MSSTSLRYFTYFLVIFSLLIVGNQKYLFWDDEERGIIDVLPKDPSQIPTLYSVEFGDIEDSYIDDDSLIVGVFYNGIAKAYPLMILDRHEVVNDNFGQQSVIISFCPLTGSSLVFTRTNYTTFGVSGKLYKNNLVLYDNSTGSLWSQVNMRCIKGEMKGIQLHILSSHLMKFGEWRILYPKTLIMLPPNFFTLNEYRAESFKDYRNSPNAGVFPLDNQNFILSNKEYVLGVKVAETYKAYRYLNLTSTKVLMDKINGVPVVVTYAYGSAQVFEAGNHSYRIFDDINMVGDDGSLWNMMTGQRIDSSDTLKLLQCLPIYWFAWNDFHPHTLLYG